MNNYNFIIISTTNFNDLKEKLRLWLIENMDKFNDNYILKIIKLENNVYEITTQPVINNSIFISLFRSISENHQYNSKIQCFITATDSKVFPADYLNQNVYLEISENHDFPSSIIVVDSVNNQFLLDINGNSHTISANIIYEEPKRVYFNLTHPVKEYIINSNYNDKINFLQRIGPIFFDLIAFIIILSISIIPLILSIENPNNEIFGDEILNPLFFIYVFGLSYVFSKDAFNGQSFGKRIAEMQIIDKESGKVASPMQCLKRNLFTILFPLEIIDLLNDPNERLGDKFAKTRLIQVNDITLQNEVNFKESIKSIILGFLLFIPGLFIFGLEFLLLKFLFSELLKIFSN